MRRVGIELGIRAPMQAVVKGAEIAKSNSLDYYFVPETHQSKYGVDAFDALSFIADLDMRTKVGTGIVSVFKEGHDQYSRNMRDLSMLASEIYEKSGGNFVLGIGTSTPQFAKMYGDKFEKPIARMTEYTRHIKSKQNLPVYWAAVGDKMVEAAGKNADGIIFFMKSESEIKKNIISIREQFYEAKKEFENFETISIRPTYITEDESEWKSHAKRTIANYVIGNPFYSNTLKRAGFWREVLEIGKCADQGTVEASKNVSDEMIEELTTHGKPDKCADEIYRYAKRSGVKTVISGLDSSKDGYNLKFFNSLEKFSANLRSLV